MHPDHPSNPPGPEAFGGLGMILTVETSDAASLFERLQRGGAPIVYPLTEEDWGQRRFMTRDPRRGPGRRGRANRTSSRILGSIHGQE
jgi:uncharacterized glyoxalase superfamily protein PhnB